MFKGQMIEHPFTKVVVKQIRKIHSKELRLLESEVKLLKELKGNPFIVNFLEHILIDEQLYLVFEFCNGGDLKEYILKNKQPLPDRILHDLFHQIINAMKALHMQHIMHRDIKLNNFVFHHGKLLLSEFGFSRKFNDEDDFIPYGYGTLETMAPEVLMHESYGIKAEIFSIGVVFYQLTKGDLPFHGQNEMELLGSIERVQLNLNGLSQELQNLLKGMLQFDENQRIDMEGVVKHPYMQKYIEELISSSQIEKNREEMKNFEFQISNPNVLSFPTYQQKQNYQQQHQQPTQRKYEIPIRYHPLPPSVDSVQNPRANCMDLQQEDKGRQYKIDELIGKAPGIQDYLTHSKESRYQQVVEQNKILSQQRYEIEVKQEQFLYNLKAAESLYLLSTKFAEYAANRKDKQHILDQIKNLSQQLSEIDEEIENIKDRLKEAYSEFQRKQLILLLENTENKKKPLLQQSFELEKQIDKFLIYIGGALMVVVEKAYYMILELSALLDNQNFKILTQQDPSYSYQVKKFVNQSLYRLSIISFGSILDYTETNRTYYDVFKSYIQQYILPRDDVDLFLFTERNLPRQNEKKFKLAYPKKLRLILLDLLVDLLNESKISFNFSQESKELHKQAVKFLTLSLIQDDSDKRLTDEEEKLDRFYLTISYLYLDKFVQESDENEMVKYDKHDKQINIFQINDFIQGIFRDEFDFEPSIVSIKEMLLDKMNLLNEVRKGYPQWPEN